MDTGRIREVGRRSWRWLALTLLTVLGVAALGGLLFGLMELQRELSMRPSPEAAVAWVVLVGVFLVLTIWVVAWRAGRRGIAAALTRETFGSTAGARLIAFGVVALVFSHGARWLVVAPLWILAQLFTELPQALSWLWGSGPRPDARPPATVEELASVLARLVQTLGRELGRIVNNVWQDIPVADVVPALALWVLLGQAFSATTGERGEPGVTRIAAYFGRLSQGQRYALALGSVFFAGMYLSIAAIVAIPWLHEDKIPASLTSESLQKAIDVVVPTLEDFGRNFPATLGDSRDPLVTLSTSVDAVTKLLADSKNSDDSRLAGSLERLVGEVRTTRLAQLETWKELREDVRQKQVQVAKTAVTTYETELRLPMSSSERAAFFREIQRSVSENLGEMHAQLRDCLRAVTDGERQIEQFARDLSAFATRLSAVQAGNSENRAQVMRTLTARDAPRVRGCTSAAPAPRLLHATPEPGQGWGPFGVLARWLLRTRSHALALITGMLGFGLFGAAITRFIRRSGGGTEASAEASDVAAVLIRGLSAAIVVFLAAKGGMAIFASSGEQEPNAYVLFLACLVGAVYSERIWRWARGKLPAEH